MLFVPEDSQINNDHVVRQSTDIGDWVSPICMHSLLNSSGIQSQDVGGIRQS